MSSLAPKEWTQAVGRRLAAVRHAAGQTQTQFAKSLGISPRAYLNYELGLREAPAALMSRMMARFAIDPEWLLNGPDESPRRMGAARIDLDALEAAVLTVAQFAEREGVRLPPEKWAAATKMIHDHGSSMAPSVVEEALSLML